MSARQPEREAAPTVPDPGETLWFGVSSTHATQGSILQTHGPVFIVARHLYMWRDCEEEQRFTSFAQL